MKTFLADEEYNNDLCELMRRVTMPGDIEIIYARDPNFFHGLDIQGKYNEIGACTVNDKLAGFGSRSIKPLYINGKPMNFGYLSSLRAVEKYRGGITSGIFSILQETTKDNRAPAYLFTITERNPYAHAALIGSRPGMPTYIDFGKYYTYAVPLNRRRTYRDNEKDIVIVRGNQVSVSDIVTFINTIGKSKQFYPVYEPADFNGSYTRGFNIDNFYVGLRNGHIVGVIGKWDQRDFKQNIIAGYHGYLKYLRPIINTVFSTAGYKPLPAKGNHLNLFYISFVSIENDDVEILRTLLEHVYQDYKADVYNYFIMGFHEKDKLRDVVKGFVTVKYISRLYLVAYDEAIEFCRGLKNGNVPYLEVGTL